MSLGKGMRMANTKMVKWKRHKKVKVPWAEYDRSRRNDCKRVLDLRRKFRKLDKPVQRREFKLSGLVVLVLFKVLLNQSYRTIWSLSDSFHLWVQLGFKRNPCYKTIQNTLQYLSVDFLHTINRSLIPTSARLCGVDSSGIKTTRRGAWVVIRFKRRMRKKDFKKVHIFVDLEKKKVLACIITGGTISDGRQLRRLLKLCKWLRIDIILGDGGYDSRDCFNDIARAHAKAGIRVRKNATTKSRHCPSRKWAVIAQQEDYDKWKEDLEYTMRCVVEAIFSAMKRRYGEIVHSIKMKYRKVEIWIRTIIWNVCIYPR